MLGVIKEKDTGEEGKIGLISFVVQPIGCFLCIHTINRLSSLQGGLIYFMYVLWWWYWGGGGGAIYFSKMQ